MTSQTLVAVLSAVVALISGYFGFSNSRLANKNKGAELQQAFTHQVMEDVERIKAESSEARADAKAARVDYEALAGQHRQLRREMDAMQDWVDRVIRARNVYAVEHPEPDDSGIIRLLGSINGGPRLGQ